MSASRPSIEQLNKDLFEAVRFGSTSTVRHLLEQGADINTRDEVGETPLIRSLQFQHPELALILLNQGADPHASTQARSNALMLAAENDYVEVVIALLERGVDPNQQNALGQTALMAAARTLRHPEIMERLVSHEGIDIDLTDSEGKTALHHLIKFRFFPEFQIRFISIIRNLILRGASSEHIEENPLITPEMITVIQHAREERRQAVIEATAEWLPVVGVPESVAELGQLR